jgi:tetratricopeptide (TPR) repeat protein
MESFDTAKFFFLEGLKHFENQEFQNAENSFLNSLELVPKRTSTLMNLAATQIKLKKYDEAETNLKRVKEIDENLAELWLNLGTLYFERQMLLEAVNYL